MNIKSMAKRARKLCEPFRVNDGDNFRLSDIDPSNTLEFTDDDKPRARLELEEGVKALAHLQDVLYAQDSWAVLLIFQAMDAAGKDGAIKHVMSGVNPQGCEVYSFKSPSNQELSHDYMWRCARSLPQRGRIGIFNRSYYEEVLVIKVHEKLLHKSKVPRELLTGDVFKERYEDMRNFERYLTRNGVAIRKFFLHLSPEEQKRRFMERLDNPLKNWKMSSSDALERQNWDAYMKAYEQMIRHTSTKYAPWYVVPADKKWFTRLVVSATVIDTLYSLKLAYPQVDGDKLAELAEARQALLSEK